MSSGLFFHFHDNYCGKSYFLTSIWVVVEIKKGWKHQSEFRSMVGNCDCAIVAVALAGPFLPILDTILTHNILLRQSWFLQTQRGMPGSRDPYPQKDWWCHQHWRQSRNEKRCRHTRCQCWSCIAERKARKGENKERLWLIYSFIPTKVHSKGNKINSNTFDQN